MAAPPDIQIIHEEETVPARGLTNLCHFPIQRHDDINFRVITYHNRTGDVTRELDLVHGTATFTANGKSIVGIYRAFDNYTFSPDGTTIYFGAGPGLFVVLPGGPVWGSTGNITIVYDADGNVLSSESHGPGFADLAACAALAP